MKFFEKMFKKIKCAIYKKYKPAMPITKEY